MLRLSKRVLLATALLTCSTPALAHPGHGPDNPILHRVVHWASGVDPASAAMFASVLALVLVAGLWHWVGPLLRLPMTSLPGTGTPRRYRTSTTRSSR